MTPRPSPGPVEGLPRVVATDCDGTLLRSDGTVSDYTRDVLGEVSRTGRSIIMVTARPPRWMNDLADLGIEGVALCGNGAFTYDLARREIVAHRLMDPDLLGELLTDLRRELPGAALATESLRGFAREPGFARPSGRSTGEWLVGEIDQIATEPAGKILITHPDWPTEVISERVAQVVAGRAEVAHSGALRLGEVTPPGVTKELALSHWCGEQDPAVPAESVWAFGDMPNDLPMLGWVGTSYAVANAHPSVLAVADHTVPANDEDGVARALAGLILHRPPVD